MTGREPTPVRPARVARRWVTAPLVPAVLLAVGALGAAASGHVLTWAVIGALTGYTLSGSV
ncbi:hypothetical protein CA850_30255 [Micromonospora echinospora]|uniref:Uncharacterized protein n=1 Tax=Micromonospora echinospora TaxID=1877 RepID=A0A1C4Z4P1_MICEC|nr:hypothetical protein [Micromonospora echinospora]OZV74299.1 hypothetical protein CA850_30255 [Micromonospora echinospora]SCF27955.1 hypothetical protein GA0070618_4771 [Micromonospora echinospora]